MCLGSKHFPLHVMESTCLEFKRIKKSVTKMCLGMCLPSKHIFYSVLNLENNLTEID